MPSQKAEKHTDVIAIYFMTDNFVRLHQTFKVFED
jgi:hypothetical protein